MIFIGKVNPNDIPKYRDGLAFGRAYFKAAGTAIYEALADKIINKIVSPKLTSAILHINKANNA